MHSTPQIIECPRDAMQGIHAFIPTSTKVSYLNHLLKVGFDELDFGSFVSEKAIPQLKDTAEVLESLDESATKLLAIVANLRGAGAACQFPRISRIGYPFSVSETFQMRNANKKLDEAFYDVERILEAAAVHKKQTVIYLSMAFGNPYEDAYSEQLVVDWMGKLKEKGGHIFAISDTVGSSTPETILSLTGACKAAFPDAEIGLHLHSTPETAAGKIDAAIQAGANRIDGALLGLGGCPMAADNLTGNIDTLMLIERLKVANKTPNLNADALGVAVQSATGIFNQYV